LTCQLSIVPPPKLLRTPLYSHRYFWTRITFDLFRSFVVVRNTLAFQLVRHPLGSLVQVTPVRVFVRFIFISLPIVQIFHRMPLSYCYDIVSLGVMSSRPFPGPPIAWRAMITRLEAFPLCHARSLSASNVSLPSLGSAPPLSTDTGPYPFSSPLVKA